MTDATKKLLIVAAAAVILIGGSVAAIAITDDSGDNRRDEPLLSAADGFEGPADLRDLLGGVFQQFLTDERLVQELPGLVDGLLDRLGNDLFSDLDGASDRNDADSDAQRKAPKDKGSKDDKAPKDKASKGEKAPKDKASKGEKAPKDAGPGETRDDEGAFRDGPFEGFEIPRGPGRFFPDGFPFGGDLFRDSPLDEFLADGWLTPEESDAAQQWFDERFGGFGFGFDFEAPAFPRDMPRFDGPFGDIPLDEFLEDGRISPDEARELERLLRESFPGGAFRFEFVPPVTDRRLPQVPDALLEGLAGIPFREFFADGELTPRERQALRGALNEWLDRLFQRFDTPTP